MHGPSLSAALRSAQWPTAGLPAAGRFAALANPAIGKHAVDRGPHTLRIEAPGFEPREESVTFDRSLLISIELHAVAPPDAGAKKKKR